MLSTLPPIQKPWLDSKKDPFTTVAYYLTYGVLVLGVILGALRCYFAWTGVRLLTDKLCLVMEDDFDGPQLSDKWLKEVQMDGYGCVYSSSSLPEKLIWFHSKEWRIFNDNCIG